MVNDLHWRKKADKLPF